MRDLTPHVFGQRQQADLRKVYKVPGLGDQQQGFVSKWLAKTGFLG